VALGPEISALAELAALFAAVLACLVLEGVLGLDERPIAGAPVEP
jgi:hypothetical protein